LFSHDLNFNFEVRTDFQKKYDRKAFEKELFRQSQEKQMFIQFFSQSMYTQRENALHILPEEISSEAESKAQGFANENLPQPKGFELDILNSHPSMKVIQDLITHMVLNIPNKEPNQMPDWMVLFYEAVRFKEPQYPLSTRIYLLKIIVEKQEIFDQYAAQFYIILVSYLGEKNSGGTGFHYFLCDVAKTIINWHTRHPEIIKKDPKLDEKTIFSSAINRIITVLPDEDTKVMISNCSILKELMEKWKHMIFIEKNTISKLLSLEEEKLKKMEKYKDNAKEVCILSKLTALTVLQFAIDNNIAIATDIKEFLSMGPESQSKYFEEKELQANIVKILNEPSKRLGQESASVLGRILKFKPSKELEQKVADMLKEMMNKTKEKNKFGLYLNYVVYSYPELLRNHPELFNEVCRIISTQKYKARGTLLLTLKIYIEKVPKQKQLTIESDINTMCQWIQDSVYKPNDSILNDNDEGNLESFLDLCLCLEKLMKHPAIDALFQVLFLQGNMGKIFSNKPTEIISFKFFSLIVEFFEKNHFSESPKMQNCIQNLIIQGFFSNFASIHKKILDTLNKMFDSFTDPMKRMLKLMESHYQPENEQQWLHLCVPLMLSLAKSSSDYSREIFDEPLTHFAQFIDIDFRNKNYYKHYNKSQPLTPIYSLTDSLPIIPETPEELKFSQDPSQIPFEKSQMIRATISPSIGSGSHPYLGFASQSQSQAQASLYEMEMW